MRLAVFDREGYRCEECRRPAGDSYWNPKTKRLVLVQLAAAHIDHEDLARFFDLTNLRSLCRADHLRFDRLYHKQSRGLRQDKSRPLFRSDVDMVELRRFQALCKLELDSGINDRGAWQGLTDALMEECLILKEQSMLEIA